MKMKKIRWILLLLSTKKNKKVMLTIDPKKIEVPKLHHYLLGAVGPRPIAFASTIDKEGNPNLSPFSFFNVFSANPPIMIFSPARSGRTGATKNTLDNVKEVSEVVINVVNYDIVQQMSLSSSPYDPSINEFVKAGLTPLPSDEIKPFRVKESPVQFECKVNEIIELGQNGGAGNLVICEVVKQMISTKNYEDIPIQKIIENKQISKNVLLKLVDENIFFRRDIKNKSGVLLDKEVISFTFDEFRDYLIADYLINILFTENSKNAIIMSSLNK